MEAALAASRVRPMLRSSSSVFEHGDAPAAACGTTSAGLANSCTTDSRPRCGSGLENSQLSSRARGGRSSFPVMEEDIVEGVFEHSEERVLLAARHLDRDRGAAMLESTARRDGQDVADIGSELWKKLTEETNYLM